MTGWFITPNDIKTWTEVNKRRAEELLPLLVKKLILASCTPTTIDFPSGDSVAVGGWDGVLVTDNGNDFIPVGKSGWEFGTNNNVSRKANEDYAKRLKAPAPFDPLDTTFTFVTSRLWIKRDKWVQSKQFAKQWKCVRGLNAETIANWLEACPAAHRWFSEIIGKRCANVWDVEQAWNEFTNRTIVKLTVGFLIHEREEEVKSLCSLISGKADIYRIKASSKNEAYALLLASFFDNEIASSRCLVIKTQDAWDFMTGSKQGLILIPYGFVPSGMGAAVTNGHTIFLVVDDKDTHSATILLNRQPRLTKEAAFKKLGFGEDDARTLFQDTKGYFEPLLRHPLLKPLDYAIPKWPENMSSDVLFAALFASHWNEKNENDRHAIETLSGLPYHNFQKTIITLSKEDDPPIRQVGDIWQVISKMDFWLVVAPQIAKPHLQRIGEVVPTVFADLDPSYDLPADERYMASIRGAVPKYSSFLKKGVADSLSLLSVYGDDFSNQLGGERPSILVHYWVRMLFEKNLNVRFWFSLGSCMRLLAESAPNEFLAAVESASAGEDPILLGLFAAEGDAMFGGCYHSDLLWSLELIAWDKQHLSRVSTCLARLAEIDPGGRWSNRPFNSLLDIYLGWINNVSATHEERLKVIENVLVPQYPDIAWNLMIKLLLNNTHSTSGICKPEYREWSVNFDKTTTNKAYFDYVNSVVELLLKEVEKDIEHRIIDLIDNFNSYNKKQQQQVIKKMLAVKVGHIEYKARTEIANKLRSTIAHHRQFPDAEWVWPSSLLNQLEKVYRHFEFKDVLKDSLFLFNDHWPKLIDPIGTTEVDYEERTELVAQKRIDAIEIIFKDYGMEGIVELTSQCTIPRLVGFSVFRSSFSDIMLPTALEWLDRGDWGKEFSEAYISAQAYDDYEKSEKILTENKLWSPAKKAMYLLCMPMKQKTFDLVAEIEAEGKGIFWSNLNQYFFRDEDVALVPYVALNLLENKRPLAAVDTIAQLFHRNKDKSVLDSRLVADILIKIATDPADAEKMSIQNVRYDILRSIEFLQDNGGISEDVMRQIEWAYLKIFRFEKNIPRYLIKSVAEDGTFFAQLVKWTFKRNDNKEDPAEEVPAELIKQRAEIAWELLDTVSMLPGQQGIDINKDTLESWIDSVRKALKESGRLEIGDDRIGGYLSRAPIGKDGIWPHEAVRAVIEKFRSPQIDEAMAVGRRNSRGVTTRHPYSGGEQERVLAKKYLSDADAIQLISPRTAEILRSISRSYEWDAEREDREVELKD